MKKQLVRLSVFQTSRVGAIVYAMLGLIYGIFFLLTMCCTTTRTYEISYAVGMILGAFLLCPIIFGFFGFVFFTFATWAYNFTAAKFGGIEYEVKVVDDINLSR